MERSTIFYPLNDDLVRRGIIFISEKKVKCSY